MKKRALAVIMAGTMAASLMAGVVSVFQHSDHRRGLFSGLGSAVCEASVLSETQGILWK